MEIFVSTTMFIIEDIIIDDRKMKISRKRCDGAWEERKSTKAISTNFQKSKWHDGLAYAEVQGRHVQRESVAIDQTNLLYFRMSLLVIPPKSTYNLWPTKDTKDFVVFRIIGFLASNILFILLLLQKE